ncbi:Ankyrin repeat [Fusarium acutatum]|uniref:Ankyrin repeat n=1 Tax=Fusarium acutatum TaxID=78861 RepID=A0A8H4NHY5_9HYPO|nr:Ankyrin repeat [Fusarium acutatum]
MTSKIGPEPWTHNDYHVGWVCALPTEQTAAIAMLDQRHAGLPKPSNDNNTYTLGSVGKHSVVIACLPKGKIGTVSAATVATSMISTFPSIKFCLMVGIGGGIPPKVRLGDVVVSTPVGAFPGVVQYDLGKAHQGGKFERIGIPAYLKELEQKWPRLAHKYLKSDFLKDHLFKTDYAHISKSAADRRAIRVNDEEAEESDAEDNCRFCDKNKMVKRKPREMRVHYGLIASGNEVIKDSIFRDKLNRDLGGQALCFEMEAAGLAHNFPCINIRGICDYADSHKNKAWQSHAAAVAAAFAKELLDQVQASDVEREPTAKEILSQIHEAVLQSDTNIREVKHKMDRKENVEILEWLTPVNYGPQQSDNFCQRLQGTGEWLLTTKEFQDWVDTGKTLFCPGVPGAGKTILTSIVINELITRFGDDNTICIAYIYGNCRRFEEQKLDFLLKSLLKQLVQGQSSMPASLEALYDKHNVRKTRASVEEVSATIHSIASLYSRIFIVFDALDELKETDDEDVRSFLDRKISRSGQLLQTHHEMIKSEIAKAVDGMFLLAQLHFQFVSTKKTLKKIKDALNSLSCGPKAYDIGYQKSMDRIASQDPDSKELGMQVLSWITCAKRVLKTLELQHALAVDKNDIKLDKENIPDVDDIVSVCAGLVTVDEEGGIIRLVHYTTQEYLDRTRDKWFPVAELEITMACMRYLSFDFFKGNNCTSRDEYEDPLAQIPFYKYASRNWGDHALMASMDGDHVILEFLEGICSSFRAIMTPSLDRWLHREGISYMATEVKAAAYFGLSHTILALLENGHAADRNDMGWWTPLSYAARNGHEEVVSLLISRDEVDPNSGDVISDMSPLSWAAKNGHAVVVKVLLEKEGVLADYADELDLTPLSYAAKNGHDAVVRLLLSRHDVDPNSTCWRRRTSLSLAAEKGHTAVVKLLLEKKGVLEDYGDIGGRIPLSFAAENGHEAVVRLLLAMDTLGASRMGSYSRSVPFDYASAPLYYAAVEGGHRRVVKPLMTKTRVTSDESLLGSDASKGPEKGLALFLRSSTIPDRNVEDQKTMIQGADKHGEYGSPFHLGQPSSERISLHWASENGHLALAETLLQKGAAINARRWTHFI